MTIIGVYKLREKTEWTLITSEGKGVCDDPKRPCTKEAIYTLFKQSYAWLCNSFVVVRVRLRLNSLYQLKFVFLEIVIDIDRWSNK